MKANQKFRSALGGALAAGGDPATSPLYVFGPLLRLVVPAGVASVTFGPSIWLVVFTVSAVSLMYRLVISWVTDGTGGSGLSEEEFGGWAATVNASITFVEYSLTFLVSMAALITFLGDRFDFIEGSFLGIEGRLTSAIGLSALTGVLVSKGPRVSALAFGPATGGVLVLLWLMVGAAIVRFGFQLPSFSLSAFRGDNLGFTLSGYARILALMTGIEVFANLVSAYEGTPQQRSRQAFRSLLIIMGSTAATMLVVGPAILRIADVERVDVSVFTQTMDVLLPGPLSYVGTAVSVAVLLSACATATQGIAHLGHGLSHRHYVPEWLGEVNKNGIAERIVWLLILVLGLCFATFGTQETTYLALYAAGVFVLLSMTGWAAAKRLILIVRGRATTSVALQLMGVMAAALLTTLATTIIFAERFSDGAWLYLALIPVLVLGLTFVRRRRGMPSPEEDYLGRCLACLCPGHVPQECACTVSAGATHGGSGDQCEVLPRTTTSEIE